MPSIRQVKTKSKKIAVQVVRYEQRKVVVMKHLGSGRLPEEIAFLKEQARLWIEETTHQRSFFVSPHMKVDLKHLTLASCDYLGFRYNLLYDVLSHTAKRFGLTEGIDSLFVDLCFMRLVEPVSKRRSLTLLQRYFGIAYEERPLYQLLPTFETYKKEVVRKVISVCQEEFAFDFSLVFYDVTTLYFESFESDDLRKNGFSKDNKFNQPQIVLGLLVNTDGFPVSYDLFKGNTFEGKTILPVLREFVQTNKVSLLTVVADAAMMGLSNLQEIKQNGWQYIVGARTANLPRTTIEQIATSLGNQDGNTVRLETTHGDLLCSFSQKRYAKDKREMDKQVTKAKASIQKGGESKRMKFVSQTKKNVCTFNDNLLQKTTLLLGIKGYYTNIPKEKMTEREILEHYHNLWRVEQAFRITKSDLSARPIFHHKGEAIKAHILICFTSLALAKYLELKTGISIKHFIDLLKQITDAQMKDKLTQQIFPLRSPISNETKSLLTKLNMSY